MNGDTKYILSGGYCFSIRNAGPFVIGADFEAPGHAGRILTRIKIDRPTWERLWSLVLQEAGGNAIDNLSDAILEVDVAKRRIEFKNGVNDSLSLYISNCQFQSDIPNFRKQLLKLRHAVKRFEYQLPNRSTPLNHFLFGTYTGQAMLLDRLKPSEQTLDLLQNSWRDRVGIAAIKEILETVLRNIEAAQSLIGNKKPRHHQVSIFVRSLAMVWKKTTGRWPRSGRHPIHSTQSGPFADFVRATNNVLPKSFRIANLDRAIRAACEHPA